MKNKSEQKKMMYDEERLKGIETCEVLVRSVLAFGMDHINNLEVKDIGVLLKLNSSIKLLKSLLFNKLKLTSYCNLRT